MSNLKDQVVHGSRKAKAKIHSVFNDFVQFIAKGNVYMIDG